MAKRYLLYLLRWQLSTPILAFSMVFFQFGVTWNTIIANLIGGLIFFWVDRYIFSMKSSSPRWEIAENIDCSECHKNTKYGYCLVESGKYFLSRKEIKFHCVQCMPVKAVKLRELGIQPYSVS